MTDQPLPLADFDIPEPQPEATIQERFEAFHEANPWVFLSLVMLATQAKLDGRDKVGMKHLVEILRWTYGRQTNGREFRFDNRYTSRYARLVAQQRPDLADLFETRKLRAA